MLPPLSRPASLAPLPEYPLSRGAGAGAGFFPAGRFAGGTGGPGLPFAAGVGTTLVAGGGGGGGGTACATSCTYADGTQPEAELSDRLASHQPKHRLMSVCTTQGVDTVLTIRLFLCDHDDLALLHAKLSARLASKVVHCLIGWFFWSWRSHWRRWWRRA